MESNTKKIRNRTEERIAVEQRIPPVAVHTLEGFHDRFLIIDKQDLYHLGASIKDLGKQCFAFSKLDSLAPKVLSRLPETPTLKT